MSKTQGLNVAEGQGMQLVCAGDVMGWLGGLPLSMIEDVRMGWPTANAKTAFCAYEREARLNGIFASMEMRTV